MPRDTAADRGPPPPRKRHRLIGLVLLVVLAGAVALGVSGVLTRRRSEARLEAWTTAQAIPTVNVCLLYTSRCV